MKMKNMMVDQHWDIEMSEKIEATSGEIPFHGLPVYKVSSNFRLDQSEMDTIVKVSFVRSESKQGNDDDISKRGDRGVRR